MWFTEFRGNKIGRIEVGSTTLPPAPPPPLPVPPSSTTASPTATRKACRVPKVRGLTVQRARKKLRKAHCRFRIRGKGRVVSSRPRSGERTPTVQLQARRA